MNFRYVTQGFAVCGLAGGAIMAGPLPDVPMEQRGDELEGQFRNLKEQISRIPTQVFPELGVQRDASPPVQQLYKCERRKYWVLSLDGGGTRGILHLDNLVDLEKRTGHRIIDMFDVVAGTSVGGVIATLLTMPKVDDEAIPQKIRQAEYTPQDLLDIFLEEKETMFQAKWQSFWGMFRTQYKTSVFKDFLEGMLGDNRFKDRLLPTVLVAHDLETYKLRLLSTIDENDYYAADVAMATAAAPTYFKPQTLSPIGKKSIEYFVSDGGTCMNNPALAGIALLHAKYPEAKREDIHVVSFGTGVSDKPMSNEELRRGGALSWIPHVPNLCMIGQQSADDELARLYCDDRYHRLNPPLEPEQLRMFEVSEDHVESILNANREMRNKAKNLPYLIYRLKMAAMAKNPLRANAV